MQTVKAVKAMPGRQEGSVFQLDENSAKVHKERGNVEFVDDDAPEAGGVFVRAKTRLSGAAVTQVAAADYPEQVVGEPAEGEQGEAGAVVDGNGDTHTGHVPAEVSKASNKADLVAYAARLGLADESGNVYSEAELESLSKAELVDKLGLG
ncbi:MULTISPECIES: hypothetical protein [unclassified Mycobacterium]|uniref:hypothetical protein n=1 Tax=unclassified Mycobacterium TaxID=2642494 RepID=UPI0029C90625|nr:MULTISPECIES: hypothetical protein [unclassified Mycobacterium]